MLHASKPAIASPPRLALAAAAAGMAAVVVVASPAGAHTGLPAAGALDGSIHPVAGIDHLVAMVAVGVLAAAGSRRLAWAIPTGFLAGMLAGGVVGLRGAGIAGIEVLVAASVLGLGALIVLRAERRGLWLVAAVVAFGAAHGQAHGAELPSGATPVAYLAGFLVTTAALHLGGAGIGMALRRSATARVATGALVSTVGASLLLAG